MISPLQWKVAIKKMDMEAVTEFLAELKVLTNVHHLNLLKVGDHQDLFPNKGRWNFNQKVFVE
ncbi:hypothetical protein P3S68_008722 [Capsicum galapagoense]